MVEKIVKKIDIPMVKLEIELSEKFYDEMQLAKASLEEKYEWKMDDGEYLERCIEDFMIMIATLEGQLKSIESNLDMIEDTLIKPPLDKDSHYHG